MHKLPEQREAQESPLENAPHVRLFFFRHDEKGQNEDGTEAGDYRVTLTEEGRKHAAKAGEEKAKTFPGANAQLVFGSPRDRSLETALLRAYPELAVTSTLEASRRAINEKLGTTLKLDTKDKDSGKVRNWAQHDTLNFRFGEPGGPMREHYDEHFLRKKDLLHYIYRASDADLLETRDRTAGSYSLYAANVGKEVLRATKVLHTMVKHDQERHGLLQNRFYGSHQSVTECFVLKVLSKTGGPAAAEQFLSKLEGDQGFAFSEGFEVDVHAKDGAPHYALRFRGEEVRFTQEILEEIIQEGVNLERAIESH